MNRALLKGDLDDAILPTICLMRHAYAMPTTRIASCKSTYNILTTDAHNTKNVVRRILKGDLDGTIFSYDCRMRFLERALLASCKNRTQLSPLNIAFTYDCRRILKHDIFRVVCVCRKGVVG